MVLNSGKRRQCMQSPQRSRHFYKSLHCWKIGLLHKFRDEELILQAGIPDVRSQTRLILLLHAVRSVPSARVSDLAEVGGSLFWSNPAW